MENLDVPFIEKYRPLVLSEVTGNEIGIEQLKTIAKTGNLPHLLITGPPGTGKTTSIMCLAREMLKETFKFAVLELNASDDRGIDVVREKIKHFAQQKITVPKGMFKIIILDEADSMTTAAQHALRMTMTEYSHTTRFALACNDSSKIIEAIQSRCVMMRFQKLTNKQILQNIIRVIKHENIQYTERGLEGLLFTSDGDMRAALNNLQAIIAGFKVLDYDYVFKICDQPKPEEINKILDACKKSQFMKAVENVAILWKEGYNAQDIVSNINKLIQNDDEIPEHTKMNYLKEVAILKMKLLSGVQTLLQINAFLATLCQISQLS